MAAESTAARDHREAEAYSDGSMTRRNDAWQTRFSHIPHGPTVRRGMQKAFELIGEVVSEGGSVVDVGCGPGTNSANVLGLGADHVLGIDISERFVAEAEALHGIPGRLEFRVQSAHEQLEGSFDLVCGFAVLHHLDFRPFLLDVYARNLSPGGRMVFWEPMGHPATLAFHRLVRSAHSEDEWPITPRDVRWLRQHFPRLRVRPVSLAATFTNAASSLVFSDPVNPLSRLGDRIDRSIESRPRLAPWGQFGIIAIDKPPKDNEG